MYRIEMELLSDALPGSGEGLAGFIDSDIVFDEDGFPYIPAKRIKGLFRESLEELKEAGLATDEPDKIFGRAGDGTGCSFRISNGYLENLVSLQKTVADKTSNDIIKKIFNREQILDYFTYTRAQTAVNEENGTAEESSLRTSRVLKKGLKFVFDAQFDSNQKDIIKNILKVTRSFGHNRTRGLGNIEFKFKDGDAGTVSSSPIINNTMSICQDKICSMKVKIKNSGQLLLTTRVGENQTTETYIPGSNILGALANYYIGIKKIEPGTDENFRNIFVSGKVIFENGYPAKENTVYYPVPLSFSTDKEKGTIHDKCALSDEEIKSLRLKGSPGEYASLGNNVRVISGSKQISYHHRRPDDKGIGHAFEDKKSTGKDTGEFFQFEVLSPGQTFVSRITGPNPLLVELSSVLATKMNFHIGKSKTAQYGEAEFIFDPIKDYTPSPLADWDQGDEIIFLFLSDMILVNENGLSFPDINIFIREMEKELNIGSDKIKPEKKFLRYKNIGGYLGVWNLPRIQNPAIAAGSIIVLKNISEKSIEKEELQKVISRSYGLRTEEGFGRITAYFEPFRSIKIEKGEIIQNITVSENTEPDDKFVNHILINQIKSYLKNETLKKLVKKDISPSFLGRLQAIIWDSKSFKDIVKISDFKKPALDKLRKIMDKLYLSLEENGDISVNQDRFKEIVKQAPDISTMLNSLYGEESGKEKFEFLVNHNLFDFYREYASNLLTFLRFSLRRNKEASHESSESSN